MRCLSEMFNVNYFLVSQTNPHIVPALNLKKRVPRKLGDLLESEWKHRRASMRTAAPALQGCLRVAVLCSWQRTPGSSLVLLCLLVQGRICQGQV